MSMKSSEGPKIYTIYPQSISNRSPKKNPSKNNPQVHPQVGYIIYKTTYPQVVHPVLYPSETWTRQIIDAENPSQSVTMTINHSDHKETTIKTTVNITIKPLLIPINPHESTINPH